jgi:hypothetical protein
MAKEGDDLRLSGMLLDLADELDAEADLIDAERAIPAATRTAPDPAAELVPVRAAKAIAV